MRGERKSWKSTPESRVEARVAEILRPALSLIIGGHPWPPMEIKTFLEEKMKKILFIMVVIAGILLLAGCPTPNDPTPTTVSFESAVQIGGTSGTADSTGLTLTFDVDPTTLAASDITVTGATKGELTGSGITRSLAISDVFIADGETVSVAITNPTGFSLSGSPKTVTIYRKSLTIGMEYQGGKLAYIIESGDSGYVSGETHGLIAATEDQSTGIPWITGGLTQATANGGTSTALGTGQSNTTAMMDQIGYTGGAAEVCDDYTNTDTGTGVYSDWYLPSKDELNKLYLNRTAVGGFSPGYYWSSSENVSDKAWSQSFATGPQDHLNKNNSFRVRAVRAF